MFNNMIKANSEIIPGAVLTLLVALALGLIISLTYRFTQKKESCLINFSKSLIVLPVIAAMILTLNRNSSDLTTAALISAGSIGFLHFHGAADRFNIFTYIIFSIGAGIACGSGYMLYAIVFTVIICVVITSLYFIKYPFIGEDNLQLKITIPENVDYEGLFDDILKVYTDSYAFRRVRTVEFGSLFEVCYEIMIKPNSSHKEFLDKIRCRNSNLSVSIGIKETLDTRP